MQFFPTLSAPVTYLINLRFVDKPYLLRPENTSGLNLGDLIRVDRKACVVAGGFDPINNEIQVTFDGITTKTATLSQIKVINEEAQLLWFDTDSKLLEMMGLDSNNIDPLTEITL